jgi:TRAP-type mannitol/chloroaromatic compound transport system permease small subunit
MLNLQSLRTGHKWPTLKDIIGHVLICLPFFVVFIAVSFSLFKNLFSIYKINKTFNKKVKHY